MYPSAFTVAFMHILEPLPDYTLGDDDFHVVVLHNVVSKAVAEVGNAFAKRRIRSIKRECLDHFVAFGCGHLDYLVEQYAEHYHDERPHQGLGNLLVRDIHSPPDPGGRIVRHTRLGGVLKHYERRAA